MNTLLKKPDAESISLAAKLLREGNIVAIPTETVYGIAGDATNGEAIKKIFEAKGRPQDNPLIVHISDMDMLYEVVASVNDDALKLADAFWPGPLTIILPKGDKISPENCAGLDSVGVRMPSDPVAHAIIKESGIPLGAPSANLSGKPSPTSAEDVFADMDGRLPLIIDGGDCFCGVESTVVSLLEDIPVLLRPGYVTKEDIGEQLDFASVDVSFISLKLVLPVLKELLKDNGEAVCLIKPQFEAGREKVGKNGVVREKETHIEVINMVKEYVLSQEFSILGIDFSPIKGPKGNIEYLIYIKKCSTEPKEFDVNSIVDTAHEEAN